MSGFTTTGSVTLDQAAYDRLAYFPLRAELYFDGFADVMPTRQSMPGSSVIFYLPTEMSVATTALDESTDVTPVALADSQVTVTLLEHGNAAVTTAKLRGVAYITVDPIVANLIGRNAGESMDTVAREVMSAGSNIRYAGNSTARNTTGPDDLLDAHDVRIANAQLTAANVPSFGGKYAAVIHPDVSLDLREETGAAAWRDPHTYSQPAEIWNGEVGSFEGFRFLESPRARVFADAGSSTTLTDVYATLFFGRQALAKAYSYTDGNGSQPKVIAGPITDKLRRFQPLGWYWLGGYGRFREACLRRVESASSIGSN